MCVVVAGVATIFMAAMEAVQAGTLTGDFETDIKKVSRTGKKTNQDGSEQTITADFSYHFSNLSDISFADEVISFKSEVKKEDVKSKEATFEIFNDPTTALGRHNSEWGKEIADFRDDVSLGNGGELVLKFTDNALVGSNDSKADLWIFEVGSIDERVDVYISKDGDIWSPVGKNVDKEGGVIKNKGIDIDQYGFTSADRFQYVKLVDDGSNTYIDENGDDKYKGGWSGADIDAVAAISTVQVQVPEPTSLLGVLVIGMVGGSSLLKRKVQQDTIS